MRDVSLKDLLEAGCHFGHQVTRQNPRAREFIFQAREGVHIIDLAKTREGLLTAADFISQLSAKGGTLVLLGTKRQAKSMILEAAEKIGVFTVTNRWIGGTLTNFDEVGKNYKKLKDLQSRLQNEEERVKYTKKEVGMWDKDRVKLEKFYGGIYQLAKLPDAIFIVDTHKEDQAVREANRMGVPVVGIVDTNADPTVVDYPIPANDDAVGSLKFIIDFITEAWLIGQKVRMKNEELRMKNEEKAKEEIKDKKVEQVEQVGKVSEASLLQEQNVDKQAKTAKAEKPVVKEKGKKTSKESVKAKGK